jgi:hypothetical protein
VENDYSAGGDHMDGLLAALYNGRLAMFGTIIALFCADYFLQDYTVSSMTILANTATFLFSPF